MCSFAALSPDRRSIEELEVVEVLSGLERRDENAELGAELLDDPKDAVAASLNRRAGICSNSSCVQPLPLVGVCNSPITVAYCDVLILPRHRDTM